MIGMKDVIEKIQKGFLIKEAVADEQEAVAIHLTIHN